MLVSLIRGFDGQLRADFARYYGLAWLRGRVAGMGLQAVADLAAHLPDDSATKRAIGGGWTLAEQLSALVADRLQILIWQQTGDGQKGRNPPTPIERPGFEDETSATIKGERMSLAQASKWMATRRAPSLPAGMVEYVTPSGKRKIVTEKQAAYWSRNK